MPRFMHKGITYHYEKWGTPSSKAPYVLLHGFAQSTHTWGEVASGLARDNYVVAIDLVGHGQSDRPSDPSAYTPLFQVNALDALFDHLGFAQVVLVGYSMGGRIAAYYAVTYPARIQRLILESAGLGAQTDKEREAMRQRDEALVARLHESSLESFFDYWQALPLFQTQLDLSEEIRARIRQERMQNDSHALAFTIQESGQHTMLDLRQVLIDAPFETCYIAGLHDTRYSAIAKDLSGSRIKTVFLDAGHNTHLEKPQEFLQVIM